MSREGWSATGTRRGAAEGQPNVPFWTHTVDGDGNALGENVAISTDKSRNFRESVVLEVLVGGLLGVGLDNLNLEVVGLSHGENRRGAGVRLKEKQVSSRARSDQLSSTMDAPRMCKAFRTPSSLALQVGKAG
jgi:hypothetical protein